MGKQAGDDLNDAFRREPLGKIDSCHVPMNVKLVNPSSSK